MNQQHKRTCEIIIILVVVVYVSYQVFMYNKKINKIKTSQICLYYPPRIHDPPFPITFQNGDVLLISDKNPIAPYMVTQCIWNHVGVMVQNPFTHLWYVLHVQNKPSLLYNITNNVTVAAVELLPLCKFICKDYIVGHRALLPNTTLDYNKIISFIHKNQSICFNYDFVYRSLVRSFQYFITMPSLQDNEYFQTSRYCATFIYDFFVYMGVFHQKKNHTISYNMLQSGDFSKNNDELPFIKGFSFSAIQFIKNSKHKKIK